MQPDEAMPDWMKGSNKGKRTLTASMVKHDAKPTVVYNETVYGDAITEERAKELGDRAIEAVKWPLKSSPFGVQAYALWRAGSPGAPTANKPGFCFYMEQGLGKTKTTLANFAALYNAGVYDSMIVVTVNSMKATWKSEMEEEDYPFDIHVWPRYKNLPSKTDGQVVVINYEALFRRGGDMLFPWMRRGKTYLAFDESTGLMNPDSSQAKSGINLSAMASGVRMLAGKPNPNGPHNMWGQLKAIGAPVGVFNAFRNRFCVMGGYQRRNVVGQKNIESLTELLLPRAFFADKKTWAPTLPEKKNASLVCEMSDNQKKAYRTMARELYAEVDGALVEIERTLHKTMKLQQISSGWIYDEEKNVHVIDPGKKNPKIELVKDFITNSSGKTLIFAHYDATIQMLLKAFPNAPYALSKQRMPESQLEQNKARFNSDSDMEPFIASSSVLKFGHTLIGTPVNPCQNVLFVENTYSLLTRMQAEDRSHRWGASCDIVTYYDIICSSVDKVLIRALRERDELANHLLQALRSEVDDV